MPFFREVSIHLEQLQAVTDKRIHVGITVLVHPAVQVADKLLTCHRAAGTGQSTQLHHLGACHQDTGCVFIIEDATTAIERNFHACSACLGDRVAHQRGGLRAAVACTGASLGAAPVKIHVVPLPAGGGACGGSACGLGNAHRGQSVGGLNGKLGHDRHIGHCLFHQFNGMAEQLMISKGAVLCHGNAGSVEVQLDGIRTRESEFLSLMSPIFLPVTALDDVAVMADRHPQLDVGVHLFFNFAHFLTIFFQRIDTVWNLAAHSMAVDGHLSAKHCLGVRAYKAAAARTVAIVAQHYGTGPHFSAL